MQWHHLCDLFPPVSHLVLCSRDGKGVDNSSPETTTDDSDPLDWAGPDKGSAQVPAIPRVPLAMKPQLKDTAARGCAHLLAMLKPAPCSRLLRGHSRSRCILLLAPGDHVPTQLHYGHLIVHMLNGLSSACVVYAVPVEEGMQRELSSIWRQLADLFAIHRHYADLMQSSKVRHARTCQCAARGCSKQTQVRCVMRPCG